MLVSSQQSMTLDYASLLKNVTNHRFELETEQDGTIGIKTKSFRYDSTILDSGHDVY
jgi:hypothetical protein